jgi:hypothetical protein
MTLSAIALPLAKVAPACISAVPRKPDPRPASGERPFSGPLARLLPRCPMAHCGLQNPSKPLRFIAAMFGRFARKGKTINIEAPSTNLGVRSSNLFGRAKQYIDITIDYQFANSAFPAFTIYIATVSPRLATGVQVTLWQLSREKSLIAKRCEMKGNSGHTSKANFGSAFVSSNPPTPATQGLVLSSPDSDIHQVILTRGSYAVPPPCSRSDSQQSTIEARCITDCDPVLGVSG